MVTILLKGSSMVKPAKATWNGRVPLSELDLIDTITHVPIIYLYKPQPFWHTPCDKIINTLKDSLSLILVHFYPLAGRLLPVGRGRFELDCNAMGVKLIEAQCPLDLDGLFTSGDNQYPFLVPSIDYETTPIEQLPLLLVQVTKFNCGAICLGIATSHAVADGASSQHFVTEWARLARGEAALFSQPFLDRKVLRARDDLSLKGLNSPIFHHTQFDPPPTLIGDESNGENEREKKTKGVKLKVTKSQIDQLKDKAKLNDFNGFKSSRPFSRFEIISAHIWRCVCKARGHEFQQQTQIGVIVDIRNRIEPPLPKNYFGNAIVEVVATGLSGEIVSQPLSHVVGRIRRAIETVTNDYVQSEIDFLRNQEDLSKFRDEGEEGFFGNPNLYVISWLTLPVHGIDFGWGNEIYMGPAIFDDTDGSTIIIPSSEGDGSVVVALSLQEMYVEAFKNIFYKDI